MIWRFFQNLGGQESGFHDAGVETFRGNLERSLAREVIQNSLDARDDPKKPVLVKFELLTLGASAIPDMASLAAALGRCEEFWPKDKKAMAFFQRAKKLARSGKITALRIGDFNTKGVTGSDTDRTDCWYSLLRCTGTSSKFGGEGGSFGIGKNAPFAASNMRTVLYSTMTKKRKVAFQGVAKLVSHLHPKAGLVQDTAYLGGGGGESIRSKGKIPAAFLRVSPGTDVTVLAYDASGDWKKDLTFSVLEYFWPAIHFGDLMVVVDGTKIEKKNLKKFLDAYSTEGEFTAHHYYRSLTSTEAEKFEENLPTLKKVRVNLLSGDQDLPRRVAMVRKTGMVIYQQQFRSLVPFCGIFLCRNDVGNALLREMEPPKHDEWDANHPDKNAHKQTASEFLQYIRDCVKKLAPVDSEKVLDIPELGRYLPDDEDSADEGFQGPDQQLGRRESFDRKPGPQKINARRIDRQRIQMQRDPLAPLGGGADDDIISTEGTREGGGDGGDGHGERRNRQGTGPQRGLRPAIPLRSRVFATDHAAGVYTVIAEPRNPINGNIILFLKAVGDDSSGTPVAIQSARLLGGRELERPKPGAMGPVAMEGLGRIRIEVRLVEPRKLAMEVVAHETE